MKKKKPARNHLHVLPLVVLALLGFLAVVFLPGPNGIISLLTKDRRLRQIRHRMHETRRRIDSLEQRRSSLRDPEFALEYARWCLGRTPDDTTEAPPRP